MGKLTAEQQKQLDDLTALASAPDDDNDFEIEIVNGDRRARVPYRKGRSYLQEHFGIDLDPPPADPSADPSGTPPVDPPPDPKGRTSQRYFGKQGKTGEQ